MLPEEKCFKGRDRPLYDAPARDATHFIKGTPLWGPWPEGMETAMFGMGCFWCSENLFMNMHGIYSTQVGYAGGVTKNPSYEDICQGQTNHNEVVRIIFDPYILSFKELLKLFWEKHDPTTPFQQGYDIGTQYRSGIYYYSESQKKAAEDSKAAYQATIEGNGVARPIHTEVLPAPEFWMAEEYHQQYDAKPGSRSYCGLSPLGIAFPQSKL